MLQRQRLRAVDVGCREDGVPADAEQTTNVRMCVLRSQGERERNVLFNDAHFIYGYMASDIWLRIILIV